MKKTRKTTAAKQGIMTDITKGLGAENTALAQVIEETMARYFKEADEKSEARNNRLEKRLDSMHSIISRHTEEIKTLRADTSSLQDRVAHLEQCLQSMSGNLAEMEDRARRDNILIFNLKEGSEGQNLAAYLTDRIQRWFPIFAMAPPEIMRAHRLGAPRPGAGATGGTQRPRPVILKCLRFTDRDRLLNESRKNTPEVAGMQLKFASDYSEPTTKRRRPCYKIMHEARIKGFQAFLLYPATIKLQRGGETHFFKEPKEAEDFLVALNQTSD